MAEQLPVHLLLLDEEIEGEHTGTTDLVFYRIGDSVSLKPTDSAFDPSNLPSRPLAVSGALSFAHSQGFLVAWTNDMINIAKELKEHGKGSRIQGSSVAVVPIGRVNILVLSKDSSMLAGVVGTNLNFFSIVSLLDKVQEQSFSCSLSEAGAVKDFMRRKSEEKSFIVLSVDWSVEGDFVAVAKKNSSSIFSIDFKEQLKMSLLFKS